MTCDLLQADALSHRKLPTRVCWRLFHDSNVVLQRCEHRLHLQAEADASLMPAGETREGAPLTSIMSSDGVKLVSLVSLCNADVNTAGCQAVMHSGTSVFPFPFINRLSKRLFSVKYESGQAAGKSHHR